MITTLFRSDDLPPSERFDQWRAATSRSLMPTRISTEHPEAFQAELRLLDLGSVQITKLCYTPLTCFREPLHIRRADPEMYQLSMTHRGTTTMERGGHQESATVGDILLYDTWHPYAGHTASGRGGTVSHLQLQIPRGAMSLPLRQADELIGRRLPARGGSGAILARFLTESFAQGADLGHVEASALGQAALHLASAFLARLTDTEHALAPETRHAALAARIHAFIERNLADPDLSPSVIAAVNHVSLRHLHRLFAAEGNTVQAYIRQLRLERCQQDLADPRWAALPIGALAKRWGFSHPSDFSRAFRTAFGNSPREWRQCQQLSAPGSGPAGARSHSGQQLTSRA